MSEITTVGLLNSELTTKGRSSVVDTISSDQKLFFFVIELLTKGQLPVVDSLDLSQGCPLQRSCTVLNTCVYSVTPKPGK